MDGDDLTAASGTLPWNKLADWMQRLANIALNIATTAWTFTQAIVMQSTLAVTGAVSAASVAATGAITAASAVISGMPGSLSAVTATFSGLLTGAAATFSGLLTANGGIAVMTPLTVGGTGVAFQNSFVAGTPGGPRYWKDPFGVVHVDGSLKNTTTPGAAAIVFTLPSGYHPTRQLTFSLRNVTASSQVECVVETNGDFKVNYSVANETVYVDGITFPTF